MVKVIFGAMGSSVASGSNAFLANESSTRALLDVLERYGVEEIDTARVYGADGHSERMLGLAQAQTRFELATKAPGFAPGSLSRANILKNCDLSLAALKQQKIDLYYLHGPDSKTPLSETLSAIDELHKQGKFRDFGISNFTSTQIQEIYDICKSNGYVLPSVYQGGYNPILRRSDTTRIPVCRRLGIAFYAFSPLAGGFLAKPLDAVLKPATGSRFEAMSVFGDIYCRPEFIEGVERLKAVLDRHGIEVRNATLRWFVHHSPLGPGDGVILGASSLAQIERNLQDTQGGALPNEVVTALEDLWTAVKDVKVAYEPE